MQSIRFFVIWLLLVLLTWLRANGQVVINEYSCANINTVTDFYNKYEDWFELYNAGSTPVDLTGYYLSDRVNNPTKWMIPSGTIAANGFIRVFANGRNTVAGGQLHPSFKLTQTRAERIVLANPSGQIIDSVTTKLHQPNHSWGRQTDGGPNWAVFTTPTCGTTNGSTSYTRYAVRPAFSIPGGFYTGSATVSISTVEPGATIYYTTNGAVPTTASTLYSGPLTFTQTTVLKAYVVPAQSDVLPSFYEFFTYFIDVSHTVAVVSIHGNQIQNLLNGNGGLNPVTAIEWYETDQSFTFKTVGRSDKHGNDSWAYQQRGIDYVAWDQYGYNHFMEHKIFPRTDRDEFQRFMFKAGASDNYPFGPAPKCHIRDAFVQDYAQKIGLEMDGRSLRHNVLYVNGEYWGLYETREKVDDADYTEHYYNQGEWDIDVLKYWGGLQIDYGSDTGWVNLYNYIMNPGNPMTDPVKYDYVKSKLNFNSVIDHTIYNTFVVNSDWINWNTAWWRGRNPNGDKKKWRYIMWDMDNVLGLGQNFSGWPTTGPTANPCGLNNNFASAGPNMGHLNIVNKLLVNEEFETMYVNRYADLINGYLSCDSVQAHLDYLLGIITPEMPAQINRWGGTMAGWQSNVQNMKNFIDTRCTAIAAVVADCYNVPGPYSLTVLIDPPGSGSVKINAFQPGSFPFTGQYFGSVEMTLESYVNADYIFGYWIPGVTTTVTPNILSSTINIMLTGSDTITAHFKYWPLVGIDETAPDAAVVAVFPTVTNDQLIVDFRNLPGAVQSCRITSLTGQLVADVSDRMSGLVEGREIISLRELGLAAGMYFVEFRAGSFRQVAKVIKTSE